MKTLTYSNYCKMCDAIDEFIYKNKDSFFAPHIKGKMRKTNPSLPSNKELQDGCINNFISCGLCKDSSRVGFFLQNYNKEETKDLAFLILIVDKYPEIEEFIIGSDIWKISQSLGLNEKARWINEKIIQYKNCKRNRD